MNIKVNLILIAVSVLILSACTTSPAPSPSTPTVSPETNVNQESPSAQYTLEEVAAHNQASDCWIVISDEVYNVSGFGDSGHPGGEIIYQSCGQDATKSFEERPGSGTPHSDRARQLLNKFRIGTLKI